MRDYGHRRGCSKPAGSSRCPNRWSTRPTANTRTISLPYIRDRRTEQHRSPAVRWIWAHGHGGLGRLVSKSYKDYEKKLLTLTTIAIAIPALEQISTRHTARTHDAHIRAPHN